MVFTYCLVVSVNNGFLFQSKNFPFLSGISRSTCWILPRMNFLVRRVYLNSTRTTRNFVLHRNPKYSENHSASKAKNPRKRSPLIFNDKIPLYPSVVYNPYTTNVVIVTLYDVSVLIDQKIRNSQIYSVRCYEAKLPSSRVNRYLCYIPAIANTYYYRRGRTVPKVTCLYVYHIKIR